MYYYVKNSLDENAVKRQFFQTVLSSGDADKGFLEHIKNPANIQIKTSVMFHAVAEVQSFVYFSYSDKNYYTYTSGYNARLRGDTVYINEERSTGSYRSNESDHADITKKIVYKYVRGNITYAANDLTFSYTRNGPVWATSVTTPRALDEYGESEFIKSCWKQTKFSNLSSCAKEIARAVENSDYKKVYDDELKAYRSALQNSNSDAKRIKINGVKVIDCSECDIYFQPDYYISVTYEGKSYTTYIDVDRIKRIKFTQMHIKVSKEAAERGYRKLYKQKKAKSIDKGAWLTGSLFCMLTFILSIAFRSQVGAAEVPQWLRSCALFPVTLCDLLCVIALTVVFCIASRVHDRRIAYEQDDSFKKYNIYDARLTVWRTIFYILFSITIAYAVLQAAALIVIL